MPRKSRPPAPKQSLASLFDKLLDDLKLKNDAALARAVKVTAPEICKARHGKNTINAILILKLHENLGIPVADIRSHIKDVPA